MHVKPCLSVWKSAFIETIIRILCRFQAFRCMARWYHYPQYLTGPPLPPLRDSMLDVLTYLLLYLLSQLTYLLVLLILISLYVDLKWSGTIKNDLTYIVYRCNM